MPATTSATLLMIEDDAMVRRSIAAFLEGSGFAVLEAADGREGLEIFRREQPDLVLTDLRMPRLDGLAVIAALQEASPDTPIIVVSGAGKLEDAIEAVRRGAWDYVTRPIPDMAALELTVNRALERARLLRENRAHQEHLGQLVQERTAELRNTNEQLQLELTEHQRAEEALRAAEAKYRALVEQIAAVIYVDAIGDLSSTLYISPQVESMLGYSPEECTAQPEIWLTFIHPDDLQAWLTENKRTNETGERFQLDYRLMARDGRIVWVHDEASLTYDDSGQPLFWQGVLVDITERKQAEEALRESEERSRWLFTTSPDAILLIDPHASNVSWPIVDCNGAACQMNGYTREELIGQSVDILNTAPGTREERMAYLDRLRREGVIHVEAFHRHKDGHVFPIEVSTSLFTFEGRELVLGIDRDITERKRAEEQLRASKLIIEGIINTIPVRVFWKDKNLVYLGCNAVFARDAGFTDPKDVIGKDDYQMGWRNQAELYRGDDRQVIESGSSKLHVEEPQTTPEGNTITLLTSKVPLRSSKGEVIGVLGTYMDITERKRAEDEIQHLSRFPTENPHPILRIERKGGILFANQSSAPILTAWGRAVGQDVPADWHRQIAAAFEAGKNKEVEIDCKGQIFSCILTPILGEGYINIYGRDITERKRAEEKLQNSEAFLNRMIEQSPSAMWIADNQGNLIRLNQACCDLLNITADEVVGRYNIFQDNIVKEQGFLPQVKAVFERGETARFEIRYDSSQVEGLKLQRTVAVFLDVTIFPIKDAHGRITHAVIQHNNITERKQAEETLKEIERVKTELLEKLNEAQHFAMIGSWEWNLLTNHVWWSDETYRIFGVTPQDFVPSFEANGKFIHPDDFARYGKSFEHSLQTGESLDVDLRLIANDGLLKHCHAKGKVIYGDSGQPIRFIGTIMDITERKGAEVALRESEAQYRLLADHMTDTVWLMDMNLQTTYNSPSTEKLRGYTTEEIRQLALEKNLTPTSLQLAMEAFSDEMSKVLADPTYAFARTLELEFYRKDGTTFWSENTFSLIRDKNGNPVSILGEGRDITERKRAEAQLAEQLDELRRWHDVTLGRENRILDLKREVNELLAQAGQPPRYASAESENQEEK